MKDKKIPGILVELSVHGEYDLEDFRQAVVFGKHPDGEPLNRDMPRWRMGDCTGEHYL